MLTFSATASDPEDGDLLGDLIWASSKEGTLGAGASVSAALTRVGRHTITATATDPSGGRLSASIAVRAARRIGPRQHQRSAWSADDCTP